MAHRGNVKLTDPMDDVYHIDLGPSLADVLAVLDAIGNAMAGSEVSEAKAQARQLARRLRATGVSSGENAYGHRPGQRCIEVTAGRFAGVNCQECYP